DVLDTSRYRVGLDHILDGGPAVLPDRHAKSGQRGRMLFRGPSPRVQSPPSVAAVPVEPPVGHANPWLAASNNAPRMCGCADSKSTTATDTRLRRRVADSRRGASCFQLPASFSLLAAACTGPQGQRRIHRASLPSNITVKTTIAKKWSDECPRCADHHLLVD